MSFDINKLKKLILIVSIIVVIIVIIMLSMTLSEKQEEIKEEKQILDQGNFIPDSYEKKIVTDHSTFFSISNCVQKYLNSISLKIENINNKTLPGSNRRSASAIYAENQDITDEKSKKQAIYNFLNPEYIKQNNITQDNILDKVESYGESEIVPLKMYELIGKSQSQYILYGKINKEDVYFIIDINKKENAFYITPIDKQKYKKIEDIQMQVPKEEIKQNKNNIYSYRIMQKNEVAQKYFTYYKTLMLEDSESAYNLLDVNYRNKRYGSLEEFQKYIEKNTEELESYISQQYEVNEKDTSTEYVCQDQYQHSYIFDVSAVMQFTVKLDNYTVETEEQKKSYQLAEERRKVEINIDKWILMINNRDYKAAYEVLDENFRNQYFKDVDEFENYMRSIFKKYYGLRFSDFSQEANVYVQKILLTDVRAIDSSVIPETIIMKLTDEGFVMSFRMLG